MAKINAARLAAAREAAGLTQEALGETVGVDARTVRNYEKEASKPSSSNLRRLAEAVGFSPEWLAADGPADLPGAPEDAPDDTPPSLPGGGPERLGYLEGSTDLPSDVWAVVHLPGGGAIHIPLEAFTTGRRVGPAVEAHLQFQGGAVQPSA